MYAQMLEEATVLLMLTEVENHIHEHEDLILILDMYLLQCKYLYIRKILERLYI